MTAPGRPAPDWNRLLPTLLDFERSPGRYPVRLREPRPLFDGVGSVMLLASGRAVQGLPATPWNEAELRRAARYFVRTVMLTQRRRPLHPAGPDTGLRAGAAA